MFVALPFIHTLWGLILASLLLEIFTLLWSPAKEALVPALVPRERLTTANSLGVLAAYGTMPLAGALVFVLKAGNDALAARVVAVAARSSARTAATPRRWPSTSTR